MAQKITVVARTVESWNNGETGLKAMNEDFTVFSGRAAAVCQMSDTYSKIIEQGDEKATKRACATAKMGHASVFGHCITTLLIETNKAIAMILNSLGVYNTSEKSARYTKMELQTTREEELYNKWVSKIQELVLKRYPDYDDDYIKKQLKKEIKDKPEYENYNIEVKNWDVVINKDATDLEDVASTAKGIEDLTEIAGVIKKSDTMPSYKIAMENARYMTSVFTPTIMMYSVSFRQAMLIIDYMHRLIDDCEKMKSNNFFEKLQTSAVEFVAELERVIGEKKIKDIKNERFRFLENCYNTSGEAKNEQIGDSYTLVYNVSFASLAQLQRHRTVRYSMYIEEENNREYFVPPIVEFYGLMDEWLEDLKSISYCVPQATLVRVTEQGIVEDFVLKCKERLCGRAQLETMKNTVESAYKFIGNKKNLSDYTQSLVDNLVRQLNNTTIEVVPRCEFPDFTCVEGCRWSKDEKLRRLI